MEKQRFLVDPSLQSVDTEMIAEERWLQMRYDSLHRLLAQTRTQLEVPIPLPGIFQRWPVSAFPRLQQAWLNIQSILLTKVSRAVEQLMGAADLLTEIQLSVGTRFRRDEARLSRIDRLSRRLELDIDLLKENAARSAATLREANDAMAAAAANRQGSFSEVGAGSASARDEGLSNEELDLFYVALEGEFRGTKEVIQERLSTYLPLIRNVVNATESKQVVDLGCGKGEWIELLKSNGIKACGVEVNKLCIEHGRNAGLEIHDCDVISYLENLKDNSVGVITGFHIIEHLPFKTLLRLFSLCRQKLEPDGMILFETPNSRNLVVGASSFYIDPTHIRPLPPELLSFVARYYGFSDAVIQYQNASVDQSYGGKASVDPDVAYLMEWVSGARDCTVIGRKR